MAIRFRSKRESNPAGFIRKCRSAGIIDSNRSTSQLGFPASAFSIGIDQAADLDHVVVVVRDPAKEMVPVISHVHNGIKAGRSRPFNQLVLVFSLIPLEVECSFVVCLRLDIQGICLPETHGLFSIRDRLRTLPDGIFILIVAAEPGSKPFAGFPVVNFIAGGGILGYDFFSAVSFFVGGHSLNGVFFLPGVFFPG